MECRDHHVCTTDLFHRQVAYLPTDEKVDGETRDVDELSQFRLPLRYQIERYDDEGRIRPVLPARFR